MNDHLPEIHQFQHEDQHFGLLVEKPLLLRVDEPTRDILNINNLSSVKKTDLINSLRSKYPQALLQEVYDELTTLQDNGFARPAPVSDSPLVLTTLFIEMPDNYANFQDVVSQSIEMIFKGAIAGESRKVLVYIKHTVTLKLLRKILQLIRQRSKQSQISLILILAVSWELWEEDLSPILKEFSAELQLIFSENSHALSIQHEKLELMRALLSKREVAVKLEGERSAAQVVDDIYRLSEIGFNLVHIDCGQYNFYQSPLNIQKLIFPQNRRFSHFGISEVVKYLSILKHTQPSNYHCGAGRWYWAVSANGDIYPCHKFIGHPQYRAGNVEQGVIDPEIYQSFINRNSAKLTPCSACWARNICGGGCPYNEILDGGNNIPEKTSRCENIRRNIEQTSILHSELSNTDKITLGKLLHNQYKFFPYWCGDEANVQMQEKTIDLNAKGDSMKPLLQEGFTLKLLFTPPEQVKIGDIVSYRNGNRIITHRLIMKLRYRGDLFFIEKGDNSFFQETLSTRVLGKVIAYTPSGNDDFLPLNTAFWKTGSFLIVISTHFLWLFYYLPYFLFLFFYHLIKQRSGIKNTLQTTLSNKSFKYSPGWLRKFSRFQTSVIMNAWLTINKIWRKYWKTDYMSRRFINLS